MTTEATTSSSASTHPALSDERGVRILAKSVFKQLKQGGASRAEIVGFTNAMLELVTSDMRETRAPDA